jgi:unsaturated rhamnogalacturonyl hydrolase
LIRIERTYNRLAAALFATLIVSPGLQSTGAAQTAAEKSAMVGDSPADPGPRATLDPSTNPAAVKAAMKLVGDWQLARFQGKFSQDWTIATMYAGFMAASRTLNDPRYADHVRQVGEHYQWTLGPRRAHADDQAIGQSYLELYRLHPDPRIITPLKTQFDAIMTQPDDPKKEVWWWCDALFMAPPVWAKLSAITGDPKYDAYMDHEWHTTDALLWDKQEHLFYRDATYFDKREKDGQKIFWSRGNGWVMGGLVRVLEVLPKTDPSYAFFLERLHQMAAKIVTLQRPDGLWSPGLLDTPAYPLPEVSGSAFFVYAMAWGINHHQLDAKTYRPVIDRAWKGLIENIYADGRLGSIQPVGAAPGAFTAASSYAFGTGAFLMAGSEVAKLPAEHEKK